MSGLSLRWRLMGAGGLAILAALTLAGFGLAQLFGAHVERRSMSELSIHLDQIIAGLDREADRLALVVPPADPRFARPYGGLYWQIEENGTLLRSRSLWDAELDLPRDTLGDSGIHSHRLAGPDGRDVLVLERSVTLPARLGGGRVRAAVAVDVADMAAAKRALVTDMAPYLAVLGLALIVAQWIQVNVGLSPLHRLGVRVAALRDGQETRMGEDWPLEVRPLARQLDDLLATREADVERARHRAGDLAHGLKTPLQALLGEAARLRTQGETAPAEGIEQVVSAMRAHVDRELARTRTAARARTTRADASAVARRVVGVLKRTPEGERLDWWVDIPEGLELAIHEADLAEALGALAENAARHATSRVEIAGRPENGMAAISIGDDGPGLPPERVAEMTARGTRADEAAPGTGLGLAIAAEIAKGADGDLTIDSGATGFVTRLSLPLA